MKFTVGTLVFSFRPGFTILVLCLVPALVSLGFWQIGRAKEKQLLLDQQTQRAEDKEMLLSSDTGDDPDQFRYRKVVVSGEFDNEHQFLLDNQIVKGKAGYFVLTPFFLDRSEKAVLINRGWVIAPFKRSILPDVEMTGKENLIKGRINHFPGVGIKLQGAEIPAEGWPSVIQLVDRDVLEKKLGYEIFNFQIELDNDQPDGYWREWKASVSMTPEKHKAYALQWFGLALTLLVLFIWFSSEKNNR